ncbi:Calcium-dependent protein kinase 25, partial [Tetrabaena socialis]
ASINACAQFLRHDDESPLKATDFGLSIRHWPDEPKLTSRSGTPAYMAPELVLQSYDEKCDIWSVGMLAYQLLTGRFPFWEDVRTQTLSDVWKAILTQDVNWNAP